jgi:hypothetical protein
MGRLERDNLHVRLHLQRHTARLRSAGFVPQSHVGLMSCTCVLIWRQDSVNQILHLQPGCREAFLVPPYFTKNLQGKLALLKPQAYDAAKPFLVPVYKRFAL